MTKTDQHVIACVDRQEDAATVLAYATHCARLLNGKGVILLNVSKDTKAEWVKEYGVPYVALRGNWSTAIEGLPSAFGGILAVTAISPSAPRTSLAHPGTMLRQFSNCKSAYLVVPTGSTPDPDHWPATTALTLDHRRESKEKLIWGSYMARFLKTDLTVASPDYKDQDLRRRWRNNMSFLDKMYRSLGVQYTAATVATSAFGNPDVATLDQLKPELLIAMTTDRRDRDVGDWLLGVPEKRLLSHPSHTPLLLLNQRDDLYVLCD